MTTLEAARAYVAAGLSVIPVGLDGLKQPAFELLPRVPDPKQPDRFKPSWAPFRERAATAAELLRWFGGARPAGIAVVCGPVSGGAECLDFDEAAVVPEFRSALDAVAPGLGEALCWVRTPEGVHAWYLTDEAEGNQALARRPATEAELQANPREKVKKVIETRGDGGYALAPGSPPEAHQSGRPYEHAGGVPLTALRTLTAEERGVLFGIARSFNRVPARAERSPANDAPGLSPADDYDRRGPAWDEVLAGTGCELARGTWDDGLIRRPGKEKGWSASVGKCRTSDGVPLFYCFTSSWAPFEPDKAYGKFNVYRLLRCGGDGKRAMRELRQKGFGGPRATHTPSDSFSLPSPYRGGSENESEGHAGTGGANQSSQTASGGYPAPIPASMLRAEQAGGDWLWRGYFARGTVTLFSALWKAGKTTLLAHLLKAFGEGGRFCGQPVAASRVLYVTEEPESLWARRRDDLGITDAVHFQVRPFRAKPRIPEWLAFVAHLGRHAEQGRFDLVLLDTFANLGPLRDENDAGLVSEALMPLHELARFSGVGLIHHVRKGDGQEATASRGSGALPAFVDTIVELRRFDPTNRQDRRRVLTGYGRFEETPEEVVVELTPDGYVDRGDRNSLAVRSISEVLIDLLPGGPPGWTFAEIVDAWPGDTVPRQTKLLEVLRQGADSGRWSRDGTGRKGSPFRFWRNGNAPQPSRNGHHAEADQLPDDPAFR